MPIEDGRLPSTEEFVARAGWSLTRTFDEAVFLRDGNHPTDGASIGTTNSLEVPPFPSALTGERSAYLHLWVEGTQDIIDIQDDLNDPGVFESVVLGFPVSSRSQEIVDGIEGTWIIAFRQTVDYVTSFSYNYYYKFIIPGPVIITEDNIADYIPDDPEPIDDTGYRVVTVGDALTLNEVKDYLRMDRDEDGHDDMLTRYINAAIKYFENTTNTVILTRRRRYITSIKRGQQLIKIPYTYGRFATGVHATDAFLRRSTWTPQDQRDPTEDDFLDEARASTSYSRHIVLKQPSPLFSTRFAHLHFAIPAMESAIVQILSAGGAFNLGLDAFIQPSNFLIISGIPYRLYSTLRPLGVALYDSVRYRNFGLLQHYLFDPAFVQVGDPNTDAYVTPSGRNISYYNTDDMLTSYEVPHDAFIDAIEKQYHTNHQGAIYIGNTWPPDDLHTSKRNAMINIEYGIPMIDENIKAALETIILQLYDGHLEIKQNSTIMRLLTPYISLEI